VDQVCFALPVLEDKTEDARAFFEELETQRKDDYAASEQRINITKESWYLQALCSRRPPARLHREPQLRQCAWHVLAVSRWV
jgi:hypothetical protein